MRAFLPVMFLLVLEGSPERSALPVAQPNDNRRPAGVLENGVLHIKLDATSALWRPDGDSLPGMLVEAFAESGHEPLAPGPLIRVPAGTEILMTVNNLLAGDTLTVALPSRAASDGRTEVDSVLIAPGRSGEIATRLGPGTYFYRGWTSARLGRPMGTSGLLAGAIVVDASPAHPDDRIFVINAVTDSLDGNGFSAPTRSVFAINGLTWPNTERLETTVGDSLHWRVINPGLEGHPMHLHGFYFRVDQLGGPRAAAKKGLEYLPRMVVTERLPEQSTMELTWVPERAGNWLFHCHFQVHVVTHGALDTVWPTIDRARIRHPEPVAHHTGDNHAMTGMSGLALGILVRPRPGAEVVASTAPRRKIRLFAVDDSGAPANAPSMRFTLDPGAARAPASPVLSLVRGEPVAITVINRLSTPTAVHWHGIELESYFDGVAGFSGANGLTSPIIAPGDSFEARMTPPRAGTFIYHSHVDELVQHRAGLVGALIVRAPGEDASHDLVWVLKSPQNRDRVAPLEVNGTENPDTTVMIRGQRYRLRLINITIGNPGATFVLTARPDSQTFRPVDDSLVQLWRPLAKDGGDLPPQVRKPRVAIQNVTIGETWDLELVPERRGNLRLEIWGDVGRKRLLSRVPIRVE